MTDRYKVAVVQASPIVFDRDRTLDKLHALAADAARQGARVVLFPEAFVSAYPRGLDFGAYVGGRTDEGREDFRRYWESSVDVPGPAIDRLSRTARACDIYLVTGIVERDGGTLYCTALFLDGDKGLVAKHRKLMPTGAERLIWGFGDGSTLPVLDTPLGRIGAVICWENYMPMLRMAMYDQGVTLYCAPTADDRDSWAGTVRHIALEGRCFVLSACQHITRSAYPDAFDCALGDDPNTILTRGGSMIVGPLGDVLAGPDFSGEAMLYATIDPAAVVRGKYDFDVTGHYARPDVFTLTVDVAAKRAVRRVGDG